MAKRKSLVSKLNLLIVLAASSVGSFIRTTPAVSWRNSNRC